MQRRLDEAGARRGQVQIALAWDSSDDLDLHLICPNGQRVNWQARQGCGAHLDVDMNINPDTRRPVENIYFADPTRSPPGRYQVVVHNFRGGPNNYRVRVNIGGQNREFSGTVGPRQFVVVTEFTLPP